MIPIYDEGYWIIAPDKKMRIGGLLEIDGRFFTESDGNHTGFVIRRARLFVTGNIHENFNYMVMGKWDFGHAGLQYAWIESLKPSYIQIRAGLFKEPFSLEQSYADTYWDFDERSVGAINFGKVRDIGVMAYGLFAYDCIEYGVGVFNGNGDKLDNNNNKDIVGRLSVYPFYTGSSALKNLGFSFSGSFGRYNENLSDTDFITGVDTAFWKWEDAKVKSRRTRLGGDIEWYYKSAAIRAEYLRANWDRVQHKAISEPFVVNSGYIESSYFLTGEDQPGNAKVVPKHPLDFKGGWGAWQLAIRYQMCHISDEPLKAGLARGANFLKGPTVAVNWFFNSYLALKTDWQYLRFNHALPNSSHAKYESVIIARLQAQF
jgi:phosphate-selective porin OprO/OprP